MAGIFNTIGNILTGGASGGTQAAASTADPFGSQRGQYQTMLADLLKDPSSVTKLPGYQFQFDQGMQALLRSEAAKGTYGGGTQDFDAVAFGQGLASSSFNQWEQILAHLAGADTGSPGTAGQLQAQGSQIGGAATGGLLGLLTSTLLGGGSAAGADISLADASNPAMIALGMVP